MGEVVGITPEYQRTIEDNGIMSSCRLIFSKRASDDANGGCANPLDHVAVFESCGGKIHKRTPDFLLDIDNLPEQTKLHLHGISDREFDAAYRYLLKHQASAPAIDQN